MAIFSEDIPIISVKWAYWTIGQEALTDGICKTIIAKGNAYEKCKIVDAK